MKYYSSDINNITNSWYLVFLIQGCVEFLKSDISGLHQKEQRCFLKRECVKLVDKRNRIEMNLEIFLFTDVIVFARRRNSSKKLVVVKQLHYLDRVQFIKSEISPTSIVVIYLDEHGMLASSLMIDMNEKFREGWMEAVEKAQVFRKIFFLKFDFFWS